MCTYLLLQAITRDSGATIDDQTTTYYSIVRKKNLTRNIYTQKYSKIKRTLDLHDDTGRVKVEAFFSTLLRVYLDTYNRHERSRLRMSSAGTVNIKFCTRELHNLGDRALRVLYAR